MTPGRDLQPRGMRTMGLLQNYVRERSRNTIVLLWAITRDMSSLMAVPTKIGEMETHHTLCCEAEQAIRTLTDQISVPERFALGRLLARTMNPPIGNKIDLCPRTLGYHPKTTNGCAYSTVRRRLQRPLLRRPEPRQRAPTTPLPILANRRVRQVPSAVAIQNQPRHESYRSTR